MGRCRVTPFVLVDGFHEATGKQYEGRIAQQLQADTDLGDRYRRWALGIKPLSKPPICIHLGERLTAEEAKQHNLTLLLLGVKCNTCSGKRHEFHCSKHQFTNAGKCRSCHNFTPNT